MLYCSRTLKDTPFSGYNWSGWLAMSRKPADKVMSDTTADSGLQSRLELLDKPPKLYRYFETLHQHSGRQYHHRFHSYHPSDALCGTIADVMVQEDAFVDVLCVWRLVSPVWLSA